MPDLNSYTYKCLEQGYLSVNPVVRVRKEDDTYYLTYKGKGFLEREEYKILMDELNVLAKTQKAFTKVVDITALGIAEITRKKEGVTLSDIVK